MAQPEREITRNKPVGELHSLVTQASLDRVTDLHNREQSIMPLAEFLALKARTDYRYQMHWLAWDLQSGLSVDEACGIWDSLSPKGRGTGGGREDLNSHFEEYIIREGKDVRVIALSDLQELMSANGIAIRLLGVSTIGNKFQTVTNVVQGINWNDPKSGVERPMIEEGPHMVLAMHAFDKRGNLHIFRTIQMRKGEAVVDTVRGFADSSALENGEVIYDIEGAGDRVKANINRVIGEEGGNQFLKIKKVVFLGTGVPNTTFVNNRKKSALFSVEVDYEHFVEANNVISTQELKRRRQQFEHEGLTGVTMDFTLGQYLDYIRYSDLTTRDFTADAAANMVVLDFLGRDHTRVKKQLSKEVNFWKELKVNDPGFYRVLMKKRAESLRKSSEQD